MQLLKKDGNGYKNMLLLKLVLLMSIPQCMRHQTETKYAESFIISFESFLKKDGKGYKNMQVLHPQCEKHQTETKYAESVLSF